MISIIVCSINNEFLELIKENIEKTIGLEYEILAIDNKNKPKGITSVYNEGARKANYDYLCFVHEDVQFNTKNWGEKLINIFNNKNIGLVGVAGCAYKSKVPSGWGAQGFEAKLVKLNIIQHYKYQNQPVTHHFLRCGEEDLAQVACVDGVFMASKKEVIEEFQFDEGLTGFHGYDIDLSIAINQKYHVYVTYDILIEHFSEGRFNKEWIESILYVHKKWSNKLPLNLADISKREMITCEKRTFRFTARLFCQFVPLKTGYEALRLSALKSLHYGTYLLMHIFLAKVYLTKAKQKRKLMR